MTKKLQNKWNDKLASKMSEPELLLYRSNLLGSDLRITNFGGGNTSAKIEMPDTLTGKNQNVLWVKGSGGDLGSMNLDGFSTLYMDKLNKLKELYRGLKYEDEMVDYLPHCTFNLNPRAASIDTSLHAFIPNKHVDHTHPDAAIAVACMKNSKKMTKIIFGEDMAWIEWQRPGFDLGLKLEKIAKSNPKLKGVILGQHGLFTWGETSKECYELTLSTIQRAADWFEKNKTKEAFGGAKYKKTLSQSERIEVASKLMPQLRGKIKTDEYKVGHFIDDKSVLEFVNSKKLHKLADLGTSCPDHFLRTKMCPLVINFDPNLKSLDKAITSTIDQLDGQVNSYRKLYTKYYKKCKRKNSPPMRDPNAVVYLIPGVGMITFAKNKSTARIAGEFYVNAINVMRDADRADQYVGLPEQEAFDIEYWLLEEAKLKRMPSPKSLAGKVAFITGGAGAIGKASAIRLMQEDACVVLADINKKQLEKTVNELASKFGEDQVRGIVCNVTKEASIKNAIRYCSLEYGGVDVLVSNAGMASSAPLEETSVEMWNQNFSILAEGYFLVCREGFKVLKAQETGGSIIIVASKNGLVASPNASAYCTAKAAELQLSRAVALEGAPFDIRCNVVNPDAVLRGSSIWDGKWRKERAAAYKIDSKELEEHYRKRSLLKKNVYPEDVAEALYFFASDESSKSTGNIINVDAGHPPSFTR